MKTRPILWAMLLGYAIVGHCNAESGPVGKRATAAQTLEASRKAAERVRIPATGYDVIIRSPDATQRGTQPAPGLLKAIVTWLANEFGLPRHYAYPSIRFESVLSYRGTLSGDARGFEGILKGQREVVAGYDPLNQTIFLPAHWSGSTPAELSMLVHEMVHHLQHVAQMKFDCGQASEKMAYAAQNKFLGLFGRDLAKDFEIDAFTLLASTTCFH
jgi:hypothetical protein